MSRPRRSLEPRTPEGDRGSQPLVVSIFPGMDFLGKAFELEGFTVVRGPDLLWGGDIRTFHLPRGLFAGVIGGPPCQLYGGLANFAHRWKLPPEHLIPEFARIVGEVGGFGLMENVPNAPLPEIPGYIVTSQVVSNRALGEEQDRLRRISFATHDGRTLVIPQSAPEHPSYARTVTSAHAGKRQRMAGRIPSLSVEEAIRLQGYPSDVFGPRSPFRRDAQLKMVVQGVPLPMGRAIAQAVKAAMYPDNAERVA